jgi:two-component system, LytTR family, response regulator
MKMENRSQILINASQQVIPNEVVFLSADANYTEVHYVDGRKTTYALTLKSLENQFVEAGFFRTHKSYLVNLQFFKEVHWKKANPFMVLSNDYRVSIARRKRTKLRRTLNDLEAMK